MTMSADSGLVINVISSVTKPSANANKKPHKHIKYKFKKKKVDLLTKTKYEYLVQKERAEKKPVTIENNPLTSKKNSKSAIDAPFPSKQSLKSFLSNLSQGKIKNELPVFKKKIKNKIETKVNNKDEVVYKRDKLNEEIKINVVETEGVDESGFGKKINATKQGHVNKLTHSTKSKTSSILDNNPPTTSTQKDNQNIEKLSHKIQPIYERLFSGSKFSELSLHPFMVKILESELKLNELTTVQKMAMPVLLKGKDALIKSQTGSGKTLAYAVPIVEILHSMRPKLNRQDGVHALIVVPTRELALQTYELMLKLVYSFKWLVPGYIVGGEKRKSEKARLRKGITILVGTPGRLLDHAKTTNSFHLEKVQFLVLDEADRMLDLGYGNDIKGLIDEVNKQKKAQTYDPISLLKSSKKITFDDKEESELRPLKETNSEQKVQTVLLSATLSPPIQKLAGLALTDPETINTADVVREEDKKIIPINEGDDTHVEPLIVPTTINQKYLIVPPKQRLLALANYIIGRAKSGPCKILIFMATQDMIDFHTELMSSILVGGEKDTDVINVLEQESKQKSYNMNDADEPSDDNDIDDDDEQPKGMINVEFFKLHGSMSQKDRIDVFKTFRVAKSGVLFCTDVAARGLDLPFVDSVVQYTGPVCDADYVHRVGRTARAGSKGEALLFLLPSEVSYVKHLQDRRIKMRPEKCLFKNITDAMDENGNEQGAIIKLQTRFEEVVESGQRLNTLACKAYSSWVRFYSGYPKDMRKYFNRKEVHLGHMAKSFAIRAAPKSIGQSSRQAGEGEGNVNNRRNVFKKSKPYSILSQKRKVFSEFDSGLDSEALKASKKPKIGGMVNSSNMKFKRNFKQ